jgi:hypothetical protein
MYTHEGPALWLAADRTTVVPEGDPRAAFLLVADGSQLSDEDVAKYGVKAKKDAPANKAKAGAAEDKSK